VYVIGDGGSRFVPVEPGAEEKDEVEVRGIEAGVRVRLDGVAGEPAKPR
jgi:hypothetical protein